MGGRWTLRDIVDYELIATMALLEAAADQREALLRQIYEVNRVDGRDGPARATRRPSSSPSRAQHDPRAAARLVERLQMGGVEVYRADAAFEADGKSYAAGHVRHADDAGLRALREGPAREADLSGGAPRADRRRPSRRTTSPRGRSAC